jgi:uncharacterized membrane protein
VTYGLIAAIGWGTSAVAATMAARRIGIYVAVLRAQGIGLVLLLLLAVFVRPSVAGLHGATALGLAGAGLVGLVGYLAFYRALTDGPVGLVSAISATYGGVATLLAVVILGEVLGGPGTGGAVLAVGGVALATARSQAAAGSAPVALSEPIVGIAPAPRPLQAISRASILFAFAAPRPAWRGPRPRGWPTPPGCSPSPAAARSGRSRSPRPCPASTRSSRW